MSLCFWVQFRRWIFVRAYIFNH